MDKLVLGLTVILSLICPSSGLHVNGSSVTEEKYPTATDLTSSKSLASTLLAKGGSAAFAPPVAGKSLAYKSAKAAAPSTVKMQFYRPEALEKQEAARANYKQDLGVLDYDPHERWPNETIFDPSVPDPVFDNREELLEYWTPYSKYGLVPIAETANSRVAMVGFGLMLLQELLFDRGILDLYGLPYDSGAVVLPPGSSFLQTESNTTSHKKTNATLHKDTKPQAHNATLVNSIKKLIPSSFIEKQARSSNQTTTSSAQSKFSSLLMQLTPASAWQGAHVKPAPRHHGVQMEQKLVAGNLAEFEISERFWEEFAEMDDDIDDLDVDALLAKCRAKPDEYKPDLNKGLDEDGNKIPKFLGIWDYPTNDFYWENEQWAEGTRRRDAMTIDNGGQHLLWVSDDTFQTIYQEFCELEDSGKLTDETMEALELRMVDLTKQEYEDRKKEIMREYTPEELEEREEKARALAIKWRDRKIANPRIMRLFGDFFGFTGPAEVINGRLAMFFLIVGLVTEYYTGQSMPQQVATLLETLAVTD